MVIAQTGEGESKKTKILNFEKYQVPKKITFSLMRERKGLLERKNTFFNNYQVKGSIN